MGFTGIVLKVGLTGGIGAGKSAVARRLAENGAILIDADRLAREVVEPGTPGFAEIVAAFGPAVVDGEGRLDRQALGALVFDDPTARGVLETIIHPRVRERTRQLTSAAPHGAIIVNDVPLLVEAGLHREYDSVLVVRASLVTRLRRLRRSRGMSQAEALARINAQATDERRAAVADVIIDNDGSYAALIEAVDRVWRQLVAQAAAAEGQPTTGGEGRSR